jgi:hypothetical protein
MLGRRNFQRATAVRRLGGAVPALLMLMVLLPLPARPDDGGDPRIWKVLRARDAQGLGQLIGEGVAVSSPGFLKYAAETDQPGIALMLLRHGADPNGWTTDRYTMNPAGSPVYIAAKRGNREILQLLKESGATMDAEAPTDSSMVSTPLLCAVYDGDLDAARLLIEYGSDVNHVSRGHNTALMQAIVYSAGHRQAEIVKLLLAHGANPDIANDQGTTARIAASDIPELNALIAAAKPPTKAQVPPAGGAQELFNIEMALFFKKQCDLNIPGFQQDSAELYRRWRKPREAWIEAIEKGPQFQAALDQLKSQGSAGGSRTPQQQAEDLKELDNQCRGDLLDEFARVPGAAPDPALATPEKAWNRYLAALRQGDRISAIACLTSTAKDKFRPILQHMTPEQMRGMADAVRSFALTGANFGNVAEAAVSMKSGAGGIIYFENVGGEWRISEM